MFNFINFIFVSDKSKNGKSTIVKMAASIAARSATFADGISAEQEQDANSALTELDKGVLDII